MKGGQLPNLGLVLLLFVGFVDFKGLEFVDLDGLISQVLFSTIAETLIVGHAGVRRAVMLGAANAHKQSQENQA